jgi:hypothetical protein
MMKIDNVKIFVNIFKLINNRLRELLPKNNRLNDDIEADAFKQHPDISLEIIEATSLHEPECSILLIPNTLKTSDDVEFLIHSA